MQTVEGDELNVEKIIVVPPDGGWGWVVVISAFFCILIMDGISNTFGLLIPIFQKEFNASVSQISLINSLFTGFYFIFAPVAGSLSNRFGFRSVIIAGSVISSFGIAVSIFTDNIQLMFATYGFIGGIGFSMMYINVVLTVGFYFERWRALATGLTVSASGVGTLSFAPVLQILLQSYTWRHIFVGYSCLVFSLSFLAISFRPLSPISLEDETEKSTKPAKNISSMHNTRYPTAAEAMDINQLTQLKESRVTLTAPSWYSSLESLELSKYTMKDYHPSRKSSRNVEMVRRPTEYSQFQYLHDLTVPCSSNLSRNHSFTCYGRNTTSRRWNTVKNCSKCCSRQKKAGVRPFYRDDIFYEGSVVKLPVYEKNSVLMKASNQSAITKGSLLYHLSVTRLPTRRDVQEERDERCHLFPESMTRALKTMFDFRVMKYPLFLLFTVSTCFLATGVNVPSYFTYVRALGLGVMNQKDASLILTAIGVTNAIGRIICGAIGSVPKINIIILHFGFLFFGALLNVCVVFLHTKEAFFIYAALYGFVLAEQGSLRSVILVQLVGLENLTNAFGILLLFLGIFTIAGTPAAGYAKELSGSYDAVFFFSSFFLLLAALTLIPIFMFKKKTYLNESPESVILQSEENQNVSKKESRNQKKIQNEEE